MMSGVKWEGAADMTGDHATVPNVVSDPDRAAPAAGPEWLLTNGLGGYAAGTVRGAASDRESRGKEKALIVRRGVRQGLA